MSPSSNPTVWCERCHRYHKKHTFTKEDRKAWVKKAAKDLADHIDAQALKRIYGDKWLSDRT